MSPTISARGKTAGSAVGLVAHLAEVDSTVFSADVLFALIVGWLGLRWDRLACQAKQENNSMSISWRLSLSQYYFPTETKGSSEWLQGTVTLSEKCDTAVDPFVVGAVPLVVKGLTLATKDAMLYIFFRVYQVKYYNVKIIWWQISGAVVVLAKP